MAPTAVAVLLVSGDAADVDIVRDALRPEHGGAPPPLPRRLPWFDLSVCAHVGAAVARLERGGVDVVLVDLAHPGAEADGVAALHRVPGGAPVIALVASGDDEAIEDALRTGAFECLDVDALGHGALARALSHAAERRGIEAVLARSEERAREAEEHVHRAEKLAMLGELVSGVAHELNNPLSSIMLFAETMLEESRSAADVEALTLIRDQARRSRAVVRDLLGFVRGTQGVRELSDVTAAIRGALGALRREGERLGVRIETTIAADLPSLEIDRAGIEQVLTNLVLNAAQAVGAGGTVRLGARRNGDGFEIVVEDDGPGIPPDVMPRLFEPFFTTKAAGQGTGLGLPMSLAIARRHGGDLLAENRSAEEGGGARFILRLPAAGAARISGETARVPAPVVPAPVPVISSPAARQPFTASAQAAAPPRAAVSVMPGADAGGERPRILIIDDEATIRGAIRRFFTRRRWDVEEAPDGAAGLEILLGDSGGTFDVIISDIRLPGLTGIELHDRLATERPALVDRLILATGDAGAAPAAELATRTRCPIMQKPFELSLLARMVEAIRAGAKV